MTNYIEVPILVYSSYESEILDKNPHELEWVSCVRKLNLSRIESYGEAIPLNDFSEENKIWTTVVMESGNEFIIDMPLPAFEKLLKNNNS